MQTPLLLGHRGVRGNRSAPENSLAAFDFALAHGCDGFEFDVRLAGEGQAVICHNPKVRGLDVSACPPENLRVPLLHDVLARYHKDAFLDIELKVEGLERKALELLKAYPPARSYVISSFLPEVLAALHGLDGTVPLGLICETKSQFSLGQDLPAQYLILHHSLVRPKVVAQLRAEGRKVLVWTLNKAADMERFAEWNVDGIISDHPETLASTLREN